MTKAIQKKALLVSLILSVWAVSASGEAPTAKKAVIEWLGAVDSERYQQSWELAGNIFQSQVDADSWAEMAAQARAPAGKLISREMVSGEYQTVLPGAPLGDYVVFTFSAKYENLNPGTETITVVLEGGIWKVIGYFIR